MNANVLNEFYKAAGVHANTLASFFNMTLSAIVGIFLLITIVGNIKAVKAGNVDEVEFLVNLTQTALVVVLILMIAN